jgi:ribonuclease-3
VDEQRRARAEEILGHTFDRPELLEAALTHPSYAAEHSDAVDYERLEFLGDAVVGFVVSDALFQLAPSAREGELTRRKHHAVCGETLAEVADELGVGDLIIFGRGADADGERVRPSVLENAIEALIGALYLDGGLDLARAFAVRVLEGRYGASDAPDNDPKSALQQYTQGVLSTLPEYRIIEAAGPPHRREFTAHVVVGGKVIGTGSGPSKQAAEKSAARAALIALRTPTECTPDAL